jgi:hypothetical protein
MSKKYTNPSDSIDKKVKCFVIQPFGKKKDTKTGASTDNDLVYEAVRGLETILPTFPIRVTRANIGKIKKEDLHDHVVQHLKDSDFCIADLTGNNPNVLYEAGCAKGLGMSVIIICQNRADIPTDLKKYITVLYSPSDLDNLAHDISLHLDIIREEITKRHDTRSRLIEMFPTRMDANIRDRITKAKDKIDILQTNLTTIQADYLQQIIETMEKNENLKLRILTLS